MKEPERAEVGCEEPISVHIAGWDQFNATFHRRDILQIESRKKVYHVLHTYGVTTEATFTEGMAEFVKKGLERGTTEQFVLGWLFIFGCGVEQDPTKAQRLFALVAEGGTAPAQSALAFFYYEGKGVPRDLKRYAELYRLAADQGNAVAQHNVACTYLSGTGLKKDEAQAKKYFQLAADQGNVASLYYLGHIYYKVDVPKALELWHRAADKGQPDALNLLGGKYDKGGDVPMDEKKAVELWTRGADIGHAGCLYNLSTCYYLGKGGLTQDFCKSAELCYQSCVKNCLEAFYPMGLKFQTGNGVAQDTTKAKEWYRKGAALGCSSCIYSMQ